MRTKKKSSFARTLVIGIALLVVAGGSLFLALTKGGKQFQVPSYTVLRVIDGDTFETTENQRIRLVGVDAPELEFCGGKEAKEALEKLVLGKFLYIKILQSDPFNRLNSIVYADEKFVNEEMLDSGWATLNDAESAKFPELRSTQANVQSEKRGIFGSICTQMVNPRIPDCNIKGINTENGEGNKFYHVPECRQYTRIEVKRYLGDKWFCTQDDAKRAGYTKSGDCP